VAESSPVYWVTFSPSAALLASVAHDGSVSVWESASGARRVHVQGGKEVKAVRFDPQEKVLVTFGAYTETRLWNLDDGSELWRIEDGASADAGVAFDPTTHSLILGGAEGTVTWWDLDTRAKRFAIPVDTFVAIMSASAETRFLVTGDADDEARAWDLDSGRLLKRMPYYPDLEALAMSPDGLSFATAGDDGPGTALLEVTRIAPPDPVAAACKGLGRNLTRDEWHRYLGVEPYRATCPNIEAEADR
jgi:WD40 repeat protein